MEETIQKKQQPIPNLIDSLFEIDELEIRIGINRSEEYVREESIRRRVEAPPTPEEMILMNV